MSRIFLIKWVAHLTIIYVSNVTKVLNCIMEMVSATHGNDFLLKPDTSLSEELDSYSLVELVPVLEEKFELKLKLADLVERENWKTAETIAAMIERVSKREKFV